MTVHAEIKATGYLSSLGYGPMQPYFQQMLMEYFSEHLMGDNYHKSSEMKNKGG